MFAIPGGLIHHLTGFGNAHHCPVTQAAFALGRSYVEREFGVAERAAKVAEDEEKARVIEARRQSETLYKVHPLDPPLLIDEGFRFWFRKPRTSEGLTWAEQRAIALGFTRHIDGRVQTLTRESNDHVVYADIRSEKKITFNVFGLPIPKGKKVCQRNFDFPDYFKHDIEEKFEVRLKDVLRGLHHA